MNDDLSVTDLTPNVIDDWLKLAMEYRTAPNTGSTHRKVIALCHAVKALRKERDALDACYSRDRHLMYETQEALQVLARDALTVLDLLDRSPSPLVGLPFDRLRHRARAALDGVKR